MQQTKDDGLDTNLDVLAYLLERDAAPTDTLYENYGPLLEVVRVLIGVVPDCQRYFDIWPPAFRSYNLIVPNFLNLPFSILGFRSPSLDIVGLGMYAASRSAECAYCSAHACSFALRRGAEPETIAAALVGGKNLSDKVLATVTAAQCLAKVPCEFNRVERTALKQHFNDAEVEWIVLGIAMMGFLNKFMDAAGVQLETSVFSETRAAMGTDWKRGRAGYALDLDKTALEPPLDDLRTRISLIRNVPTVIKLDKRWLKEVPGKWPAIGEFLQKKTGFSFPLLSKLKHRRAIRTIAAVLCENLNEAVSTIGVDLKIQAGIIFCTVIQNTALLEMIGELRGFDKVTLAQRNTLQAFSTYNAELPDSLSADRKAILYLARAASPSPAIVRGDIVRRCREAELALDGIVELITWLSVLQMLHRLSSFIDAPD